MGARTDLDIGRRASGELRNVSANFPLDPASSRNFHAISAAPSSPNSIAWC